MGVPFKGKISVHIRDSVPDWSPFEPLRAPEGASDVIYAVLDDVGFSAMRCYSGRSRRRTSTGSPTPSCLLTGRNHTRNSMACITEAAMNLASTRRNWPTGRGFERFSDVPGSQAVNVRNRSYAIGALVDIPAPGAEDVEGEDPPAVSVGTLSPPVTDDYPGTAPYYFTGGTINARVATVDLAAQGDNVLIGSAPASVP